MKKYLSMILVILCLTSTCLAASDNWQKELSKYVSEKDLHDILSSQTASETSVMVDTMAPAYKHLASCKPYKNPDIQIYGIRKNKCHFRYSQIECYLPMDITKQYATAGMKASREIMNGNTNLNSQDIQIMRAIVSNRSYCTYSKYY